MSEVTVEREEEEDGKSSGSGSRMSGADFAEARELYELGSASLGELAEKYGVTRQALSERFKRAGVVKESRKHEVAAAAGSGVKSASAAAAGAVAERFSDKRAEWIEETRIQGYQGLRLTRGLAQKIMTDAVRAGRPPASTDDDLKALGRLNKILVDNLNSALEILEARDHVDEEDLPTLVIEDLTDEDILRHHIGTGALPEGTTVEEMLDESAEIDVEEFE